MKLAVGLMTYNRPELTAVTVGTFIACNPQLGASLLHADDGSEDLRNLEIAQAAGFRTVRSGPHAGQLANLRALLDAALDLGAEHFLLMENDWRWVRGLDDLPALPPAVDCVRLYGAFKDEARKRPARPFHMGGFSEIAWVESKWPGWHEAFAHWGGPPSIARVDVLRQLAADALSYKGMSLRSMHLVTIRPAENFVFHIGDKTTEGFLP